MLSLMTPIQSPNCDIARIRFVLPLYMSLIIDAPEPMGSHEYDDLTEFENPASSILMTNLLWSNSVKNFHQYICFLLSGYFCEQAGGLADPLFK